jgi:hypothetical protein
MESSTPPRSRYMALARIQDQLGWDCFVEEQILIFLVETVRPFLHDWSPRKSIMRWGVSFLKSLLSITHKQWLFRNSDVHHIIDGLMTHQHALLNQRMHNLIQTTPKELFPMHVIYSNKTLNSLAMRIHSNHRYGWPLWNLPLVRPPISHLAISLQAACIFFGPLSIWRNPLQTTKLITSPNTSPTTSTNSTGVLLGPPKHPPTNSSPPPLAFN